MLEGIRRCCCRNNGPRYLTGILLILLLKILFSSGLFSWFPWQYLTFQSCCLSNSQRKRSLPPSCPCCPWCAIANAHRPTDLLDSLTRYLISSLQLLLHGRFETFVIAEFAPYRPLRCLGVRKSKGSRGRTVSFLWAGP